MNRCSKSSATRIRRFRPWSALFLFIAGCNLAGQLPGVQPATANLATSSALAVIVFLAVPIAGIRAHGRWKYVKHYFQPNPLMMPLHLLSEVSRNAGGFPTACSAMSCRDI